MTTIKDAVNEAEVKSGKSVKSVTKTVNNKVQELIDQIPENSKYTVLSSLVGSMNCSVIGTASMVAGRFARTDVDIRTLTVKDVLQVMQEADMRMDTLHNVRNLIRVRDVLRDQLIEVANDDDISSWTESIQYMTVPSGSSRIDKDRLVSALKVIGFDDEQMLNKMYELSLIEENADRRRNAEQIAERQGAIEWIIENVFYSKVYIDENGKFTDEIRDDKDQVLKVLYTADKVEDLPNNMQNRLYEKLRTALNKAMQRCMARFAQGDTRYELGDIMILKQLLDEAKTLEVREDD